MRSWERGLKYAAARWPLLRCLAVADQEDGHHERAADRYAEAFDDLCARVPDGAEGSPRASGTSGVSGGGEAGAREALPGSGGETSWTAATAALGGEAIGALLAVGRTADARAVWERLAPSVRARGRFRLTEAALLAAEGRRAEARAVFDEGFEVADLREGDEIIGRLWARLADEPLPARHDFRMRPDGA